MLQSYREKNVADIFPLKSVHYLAAVITSCCSIHSKRPHYWPLASIIEYIDLLTVGKLEHVRVCPLNTHTDTQLFTGRWSGSTRVGRYQKKLTHSHPSWSVSVSSGTGLTNGR